VTEGRRFAEIGTLWNALPYASLFLSWEWLDCWWQCFGGDARMCVFLNWDGPQLAAGLACGVRGQHLFAMADKRSDLFRPLGRTERDLDAVLEPVAEGPWSRITVRGLPVDDLPAGRLEAALGSRGWLMHRTFRETCPVVRTDGDYAEYRAGLGGKTRSNTSRHRRNLERAGRVEVRPLEPVLDLDAVLGESFGLEAAGWKGRSGKAVLSSQGEERFWHEVYARFHRLGRLRFSELRLDGALIAFSLDVVHRGRLYGLKTSYDEAYARHAPGCVLLMAMIEAAFASDIEAIEMLGPASPHKQRYATESRDTLILRAYRRRPISEARYRGREWIIPRVRPLYVKPREALDRIRERGLGRA